MESARPAVRSELATIEALATECRDGLAGQRGASMWLAREAPDLTEFGEAISPADSEVVAGLIDDVIVGYALVVTEPLRGDERVARLLDLYVQPEARGVGVGESMMAELLTFARSQKCHGIDAVALPGDRATKNFFETHGLVARAIVVHRRLETDS